MEWKLPDRSRSNIKTVGVGRPRPDDNQLGVTVDSKTRAFLEVDNDLLVVWVPKGSTGVRVRESVWPDF